MDSLFKRAQSKSFFLSVLNLACPNRPPPSMSRGTAFSVQQNYRYSFLYSKRSHGYNWVFVSTVKPFTSYHPLGEKRQPRVKRVKSPYMTSRITALILTIWWMKSKDYKGKRMFFLIIPLFFSILQRIRNVSFCINQIWQLHLLDIQNANEDPLR